ncbi:hypothetical protein VTK26DRAFT_7358 [Humicola hyalothermophila]
MQFARPTVVDKQGPRYRYNISLELRNSPWGGPLRHASCCNRLGDVVIGHRNSKEKKGKKEREKKRREKRKEGDRIKWLDIINPVAKRGPKLKWAKAYLWLQGCLPGGFVWFEGSKSRREQVRPGGGKSVALFEPCRS